MRTERVTPLKFAAIVIPATLAAFLTVAAIIWVLNLWMNSVLPGIGNGG